MERSSAYDELARVYPRQIRILSQATTTSDRRISCSIEKLFGLVREPISYLYHEEGRDRFRASFASVTVLRSSASMRRLVIASVCLGVLHSGQRLANQCKR